MVFLLPMVLIAKHFIGVKFGIFGNRQFGGGM